MADMDSADPKDIRIEVLEKALRQAEWPLNVPHPGPADCPTYYDGCRCSVEVLAHNIDRAEKAEDEIKIFKENIERLEKKLSSVTTQRDLAYKKLHELGWSDYEN